VLVVDDGDNGEKDHQEGGEGQSLLKGVAHLVFLDHAVEGGEQDDDRQADDADRRQVEGQGQDQPDAGHSGLDLISLGLAGCLPRLVMELTYDLHKLFSRISCIYTTCVKLLLTLILAIAYLHVNK
jgi:hypothetical protein